MKVLVSPSIDLSGDSRAVGIIGDLAGPDGVVLPLPEIGVKNLSRPLTRAEVVRLREALRSRDSSGSGRGDASGTVAWVCRGVAVPGDGRSGDDLVVAVADHVNLTWRSPLVGRNDDKIGPRFPSMTGIYAPEVVLQRLETENGIIVKPGVVAGVHDHQRLNDYENESVLVDHHLAASSELVPVVIVAAHMGLQIAAAVTTWIA